MLELSILGFLGEEALHGYELKERISALSGHVRPVSDGALYPAIARMTAAGLLTQHEEPGSAAAPRRVLTLTPAGRDRLFARLRDPKPVEITDPTRFNVLLAFLHHLDADPAAQAAVLRRRLDFLTRPAAFFYSAGRPVRLAETTDLFRRGMLQVARATSTAERAWLSEAIAALTDPSHA